MPVSSTLLNTISQRIVAALQAQQSQDGWSEYAKSRFSLVESLERLQPGIAQALQSETPEEVEAKLQGLVQKLFSGQFVLSQEGQDLLSQCYSLLLPDIQAGLLAAEASVVNYHLFMAGCEDSTILQSFYGLINSQWPIFLTGTSINRVFEEFKS